MPTQAKTNPNTRVSWEQVGIDTNWQFSTPAILYGSQVSEAMIANLRQHKELWFLWSGIFLGIVSSAVRSHLLVPFSQAIIADFVTLLFFGVVVILSSRRFPNEYLVIYALVLFTGSVLSPSFHLLAPANLLILIGSLMRFFQKRME